MCNLQIHPEIQAIYLPTRFTGYKHIVMLMRTRDRPETYVRIIWISVSLAARTTRRK